jgi:hypothetical protein
MADVAGWAAAYRGKTVAVTCRQGHKLSQGAAAWLRQEGADAEALEGGVKAWIDAGHPMVPEAALPARDAQGRTVWVTRAQPKVDRIACPWLIRHFVDPNAVFLFVAPGEVVGVAERFGAVPFDIEGDGIAWSHDGERCTFDVMLDGLLRHVTRRHVWNRIHRLTIHAHFVMHMWSCRVAGSAHETDDVALVHLLPSRDVES